MTPATKKKINTAKKTNNAILLPDGYPEISRQRDQILARRAEEAAKAVTESTASHETLSVLEFLLSSERYAIEMNTIREVAIVTRITGIPGLPNFIRGVMNYRGSILSIVDLKEFFDLPKAGITDFNRIIVLCSVDMEFGLLTDQIIGIRTINRDEILPPLPHLSAIGTDYLIGITKEPLIILRGSAILKDPRMVIA